MKLPPSLRWFLVPVVAIAGCSGVSVVSEVAGHGLRLAVSPQLLERAFPLDVRSGLIDGAAAIAFVVAGAMIAPRFRLIVAMALYSAGAYLAWFVLHPWSFPENHPRAYQPSRVPLTLTLLGGLVGVLIAFLLVRRSSAELLNERGNIGARK